MEHYEQRRHPHPPVVRGRPRSQIDVAASCGDDESAARFAGDVAYGKFERTAPLDVFARPFIPARVLSISGRWIGARLIGEILAKSPAAKKAPP
jgi:hypothetical protein